MKRESKRFSNRKGASEVFSCLPISLIQNKMSMMHKQPAPLLLLQQDVSKHAKQKAEYF